jgi:hypothetical protein
MPASYSSRMEPSHSAIGVIEPHIAPDVKAFRVGAVWGPWTISRTFMLQPEFDADKPDNPTSPEIYYPPLAAVDLCVSGHPGLQ